MKTLKLLLLSLAILLFTTGTLSQKINSTSLSKLPPKFILGAIVGYNFVVGSANGEVIGFGNSNVNESGSNIFDPSSFVMQQGGGISVFGKQSINRKRNLYLTGELGYNLFYNTHEQGIYRTKWNIFDLGTGMEFRNRSTSTNTVFFGMQLQYSLIFGGWQSNVIYPDNSIANVYVKIKPANRLGISLNTGMEFKASKKSFIIVGLKGTWANLFPKKYSTSSFAYEENLNDGKNNGRNELSNNKEIIYMQLFTGLNFSIK